MRCVIDNVVWIGNAAEARDIPRLIEQGFNVVVDLAIEEPPAQLSREQVYLRFPLHDGVGNDSYVLAAAIQIIANLVSIKGLKIIVCCSMGISRSPAIVAAALALLKNQSADIALTNITSKVACDISPGLWSEVSQVCNSLKK